MWNYHSKIMPAKDDDFRSWEFYYYLVVEKGDEADGSAVPEAEHAEFVDIYSKSVDEFKTKGAPERGEPYQPCVAFLKTYAKYNRDLEHLKEAQTLFARWGEKTGGTFIEFLADSQSCRGKGVPFEETLSLFGAWRATPDAKGTYADYRAL